MNFVIFIVSISLSLFIIFYYIRVIIYMYMSSDKENVHGVEQFYCFVEGNNPIVYQNKIGAANINLSQLFLAVGVLFWAVIHPYIMTLISILNF